GVYRPAAHPGYGATVGDAHRPRGGLRGGTARCRPGGRPLLPADARLPGAGVAAVADPQATGDPARPDGAPPGRTSFRLGCQPGQSAAAGVVGVVDHSPVDAVPELDAPPAAHESGRHPAAIDLDSRPDRGLVLCW